MDFKFKDIHIGSLIYELVREEEIDEERIVNFIKATDDEIEEMYKAKSLDSELLLRWSKLLEYDFFRIYSQHLVWYAPAFSKKEASKKTSELPQFRKNIYTTELIKFIVELVQSGKKQRNEIVEEYRIPRTTLYGWLRKHGKKDNTKL